MYWNSSEHWNGHRHHHHYGHRHHGNGWLVAVVIIGLIILTHGWILILPLMLLAALAFAAFFVPKAFCHMQKNNWYSNWSSDWHEKRKHDWSNRGDWGDWGNWGDRRNEEKSKRKNADDIDYV